MLYEVTEAAFKEDVLDAGVPVLVDFFSPTCAPCKALELHLKSLNRYTYPDLKILKVNVAQSPGLVDAFGIRAVPTLVMFQDGGAITSHTGMMNKKELEVFVEEALGEDKECT